MRGRSEEVTMKKSKMLFLLLSLLVCLGLTGCTDDFYDPLSVEGLLDGHTEEEIEELNAQTVADGMLQVSINANPVFLNGTAEGNLRIENAPGNPYDMRVSIVITEEDGRTKEIYASGGIRPNSHIENAPLSVSLEAGDHPATARFYAVDQKHKDIGVVERGITLTILE